MDQSRVALLFLKGVYIHEGMNAYLNAQAKLLKFVSSIFDESY